ncbi:PREDICTED: uncharacterized protein LOC108564073 [Nicrophorus vespilloides]|uniref:Uncharacterized protein LOC108564073 n=1 Tax=Nicrophorus vespilloides TaxID=110193 RepID=A0ABM1MV71_NICVS|nr:PREDICTED: uncharacterized protein LOC108564073 [Nicrophorus vespilloides]
MKTSLQTWKFINNEYRNFTPITVGFDLCSALKTNLFGLAVIAKEYGNWTNCPVLKGYYVMRQFTPDDGLFPPNLPLGQYKFSLTFNTHDQFLFKLSVDCVIKNRKDF